MQNGLADHSRGSYIIAMPQNMRFRYFLFFKPYGVLSQFTGDPGKHTLAEYGPFPPDVYAVGRLDADSEGLLLLTNDSTMHHVLTDPAFAHPRTYLAQVEHIPDERALASLRAGVVIEGRRTRPADVRLLAMEPPLPPRPVPIRVRKAIPTAWIEITLREGRNRQVRKMTASVGNPTLRLVRIRIDAVKLTGLAPGEAREATPLERAALLRTRDGAHRGGRGTRFV